MKTLVRTNNNYHPTLFDSVFGKNIFDHFLSPESTSLKPAVNVVESEKEFRVELAAPGLKKEDFIINVENDRLAISAERKNVSEEKGEKYSRKEFSYHSFNRVFTLPEIVNGEKISANYDAGVLSVTLPKKEAEATPTARQIEIA